jgi:dephospho-CoA kinase
MLRVGLTGGIACGKSHVRARLAVHGLRTLDLDRIAHEVTARGGAAYGDVVRAFGQGVLAADGSLDRKALGALVFADAAARGRLNAIVHPRVREEEARRADAWKDDPAAIVVSEAALLVEAGVHPRFDRLIVAHCGAEQQLQRLMARDGIGEAAARARIDSQLALDEKRRFAHFEIDTSGSPADTDRRTDAVAAELARLAEKRPLRLDLPQELALGALVHGPRRGPGGLTPAAVLEDIGVAAGLEMGSLARRLVPPPEGAWYLAAGSRSGEPGPETLVAPVVIWSLRRGAPDPDFLFAASATLARLTHREPVAIASACLMARAMLEVAAERRVPPDLLARSAAWAGEAERWGGASAPARVAAAFGAAASHPRDVPGARGAGGDLAGALTGMAVGAPATDAAPTVVEALRRLAGGARS